MAPRIRRLSLSLVAVGLAFGILATTRHAAAAASPKACAAAGRKAKASLARSLVSCGHRDATVDIGRCGADQWHRYVERLTQRGCPVEASTRAKRIRRPVVSRIQSAFSPDDLAAADIEAREAHLALRRLLERVLPTAAAARRGRPDGILAVQALAQDLAEAVARLEDAEETLSTVEDGIWHGFSGNPSLAWLIDEPLRSAMQQMQVEVRRLIGPEWSTEIVALRDEPGCQGDLIGDRLIAAYGDAVLAGGRDRSGEATALGRIAGQLACLSIRQTALVDVAISVAADRVERLLDEAGLGRIRGDFARILAPMQVLVLDTVKIAGDHAYAWHWFVRRHDLLRDVIGRLGWPTDDVVWLYDRIDGRMIGFPPCEDGDVVGRCIDVGTFLDSLIDPRALGLGDCAFSGMIAGGIRHGGGVDRYACASTDCATTAPRPGTPSRGGTSPGGLSGFFGSGASSGGQRYDLPWSGLTSKDISTMGALGCSGSAGGGGGAGGTSGESGGTQGPGGSLDDWGGRQECVVQAISQPRDPYAVYVRCVAAVAADQRAQAYDLTGVPMGPDCKPGVAAPSGGSTPPSGGSTTTAPSSGSATTTTVATTASTSTTAPPSASAPCVPTGILDAIQKIFDCGLPVLSKALTGESPSAPSGAGAIVSTEIELLKPENGQKFYDAAGAIMQHKVDLDCAAGTLSDDECAQLATMKPADQADFLRRNGHMQDCADREQCDSACTSLDAQAMARMQDCEQQLTNTLAPPPGGQNAPGTREHPSPESDPGHLPDDPFLSCLLAGADGGRSGVDLGCSLVLCPGPSAAIGSGSACCGAATPTIGVSLARIITERTCETVHCTDGESVVADGLGECGCGSGTPLSGGGPAPQPSPEGPRPPRR